MPASEFMFDGYLMRLEYYGFKAGQIQFLVSRNYCGVLDCDKRVQDWDRPDGILRERGEEIESSGLLTSRVDLIFFVCIGMCECITVTINTDTDVVIIIIIIISISISMHECIITAINTVVINI